MDQFTKSGAVFLFMEMMCLRKELEKLREEINSLSNEAMISVKR